MEEGLDGKTEKHRGEGPIHAMEAYSGPGGITNKLHAAESFLRS
jgi:hypothetical protein